MRKSAWILVVTVAVVGSAFGQDAPVKPHKLSSESPSVASEKVTRSDAHTVLMRMQRLLSSGIGITGAETKVGIHPSDSYVTRHEVIQEFGRLFAMYQPHFKFTPPKVKYDATMFTVGTGDKPTVEKLIKWGTVAKQGPIASASASTLTVHEFGDAVGFFVTRIELLTNLPPSKWTPYLNGGRGDN